MWTRLLKLGIFSIVLLIVGFSLACNGRISPSSDEQRPGQEDDNMPSKVVKTDAEWQQLLTPEQYEVTRRKGTEPAFTGKYYEFNENGVYRCVCCGNELFSSETKFDSGTGWPSFWAPISEQSIETAIDASHGMVRVEVMCQRCAAHLGHVFEDGPPPTGLRYCINSVALDFVAAAEKQK